jgi:CO/xanthine dehydrogenase Mo-binding subunit
VAAGSLVVSFNFPGLAAAARAKGATFSPNAYLRIGADDSVTIVVALVEMGQGTFTSIPMLIAEELEVDLAKVKVEQAPANAKLFGHPLYSVQITGGSTSIPGAWQKLRQVGATAKVMLVTAAAQSWNVAASECRAEKGRVRHTPTGRSVRYGELVGRASKLPVPKEAPLKDPADFKLVGTSAPRLDTSSKVNGSAKFGIDVRVPGMRIAAIALSPSIGAKVVSVDDSKALKVNGVRRVLVADDAVAVVADHYGAARKGLNALSVKWTDGTAADFSSQVWHDQLAAALKQKGRVVVNEGGYDMVSASASRRHTATYVSPPLAHSAMEPLHCTMHVRKDRCDVWLGTQAPVRVQGFVAQAIGLTQEKVAVHNHLLGGGFGRRLDAEYVIPVAKLARQVDYPLKVVFSREDDLQHDSYRPFFLDEMSAALDDAGRLIGFSHRFAGSSVLLRYEPAWATNGLDPDVAHTADSPYSVASKYVEYVRHEPPAGLQTGNWRGVGPMHHAFPNECFIDELAGVAGVDPVAFRRRMLVTKPRALGVLDLAAAKSGWGRPLPARRGRGVSLVEAFEGFAALVTEVSVDQDGQVKIEKLVCAVDCGIAVNPRGVDAQIQGGIVYGLSAALFGPITFEKGRVVQSNYHDYPPLRIQELPPIEVHLIKSGAAPGGVGELGTPLAAPSLVNAIYAATGNRLRAYPVSTAGLRLA